MDDKRASIQKYFNSKFPKWAAWVLAIGALIAFAGMSDPSGGGAAVTGIVMVAVGGFAIYWCHEYRQRPADRRVDEGRPEYSR